MTLTAPEIFGASATFDDKTGAPLTLHVTTPLVLAEAAEGEARREFTALATTYEVEVNRPNWRTGTVLFRIAKGAATFRADAKVFYGHDWQSDGTPIGRVVSATEAVEGPRILARLWQTTKADEIYALMKPDEDGVPVLDKISIGFYITAYTVEGADTDAPVLVVTGADVFEASVVPYPQFDGAAVDDVLQIRDRNTSPQKEPDMTSTITEPGADTDVLAALAKLDGLPEAVDTLSAKIATMGATTAPDSTAELFGSSYGEFVKAMASGDADAKKFAEALAEGDYAGGTSGDTIWGETWVGDIVKLIENARKVWNLFDSAPLPAEGMKLEYGKLASNTIDVQEQAEEGDAIVMGNVKITTAFADVFTFAGGSRLTLQQVKRSSIAVLDLHWRALAIAFAKATEAKARAIRAAAAAHTTGSLGELDDFDGWIDFLVDGAVHLDDKGLQPEYLNLSATQFKRLAKIREGVDGPYLLSRDTGRISLLDQTGDVAGLKIAFGKDESLGANFVEMGNSFALKTFESAGAPARLGPQEEITNLTEEIGVYGFGAIAVQDEKALVRPGV
ncbi:MULTISPECIES: HK97 family phage prohead protease [unclassified Aeromicrobium]|uniref:HK97 family phage prohead protease n=1 Tax=unclassified Aeromicrobium TaxID=2633570 RepID=UPI002889C353|nr:MULTISPECIES: HK97 family phage prohead protease [unclassified Aeromicrobium]